MNTLAANIWKMYLLKTMRWFLLIIPVLVLFFQENGLSMKEIMILQAFFSAGLFVFEIPSGYFADVIGRRASLIVGSILCTIAFGYYCLANSFWDFLIVESVLGFGSSFISGSDSALVYDTLIQLEREGEYTKIEGRLISLASMSEGVASVLGGLLATISLRTPLYFEATVMLLTIPLAFTLVEPERRKFESKSGAMRGILQIVRFALHEEIEVKWLIIYSSFVGASTLTLVWFIQPYFKQVGLPLEWFGAVWAILQFSVSGFALLAHRIEQIVGRRRSLMSLVILSAVGYYLVASLSFLWAIGFLFIFYFIRGFSNPLFQTYINRLVPSDRRATVLSVKQLIGRLIFAIVGPFIGWTVDVYSLSTALYLAGAIYLLAGIYCLLKLHQHRVI